MRRTAPGPRCVSRGYGCRRSQHSGFVVRSHQNCKGAEFGFARETRRSHLRGVRRQKANESGGSGFRAPFWYWSFHNLSDIYLFKMKVIFYILWYAPRWEDVTAQYIGGDALSYYRSVPSGERCLGDRETAGCTLGKCITVAYKMAARWTEGSEGTQGDRQAAQIGLQARRQSDSKAGETSGH